MPKLPLIQTEKELQTFLLNEKNEYTQFILDNKNLCKKHYQQTEFHHIIPLYAKGPHAQWNLIELTVFEHQKAHHLLYNVYQNKEDLCALRFRQKTGSSAYRIRASLSHEKQRLDKKGFFDPKVQRINGKKGGKVKSKAKILSYRQKLDPEWVKVLSKKSYWYYKKTKQLIEISPFECRLPQDVTKKLLTYQPFKQIYKAKEQSLTSNLTRLVKKQRKTASGWQLIQANEYTRKEIRSLNLKSKKQ